MVVQGCSNVAAEVVEMVEVKLVEKPAELPLQVLLLPLVVVVEQHLFLPVEVEDPFYQCVKAAKLTGYQQFRVYEVVVEELPLFLQGVEEEQSP